MSGPVSKTYLLQGILSISKVGFVNIYMIFFILIPLSLSPEGMMIW